MKRLSITILCLISLLGLNGQDINQTLKLADNFYENEQYEMAVKHYRRVAFFGNDSIQKAIFPIIAKCYLLTGNYKESIFFYELSSNTAQNDSLNNEYAFSRILCNIFLDNFEYAIQDLYSITDTSTAYFNKKYHFYLGIVSLKKNEYLLSEQHFIKASKDDLTSELVKEAFKGINPRQPNPKVAKILSIILPGLGQLYSGDVFNAFNSFFLNTTLAILAISIAINYSFADALFSVLPWFQRYYMGGYTRAEIIANNRRAEKCNILLQKVYSILEK